jgi:dTDP-4-dehydrorhamnose 3,5-epimerase
MQVTHTPLPGVLLFEPQTFTDNRGWFVESYNEEKYSKAGLTARFVQDNHSYSIKNVVRGLHFQQHHPQGKLVRVVAGAVFDVAVDIRRGSPTFGQWFGAMLSADNKKQLYIPPNFAHGFSVMSENAEFLYKCTDFYHPGDEIGLLWNDPQVNVDWHLNGDAVISTKDAVLPTLEDVHDRLPIYSGDD